MKLSRKNSYFLSLNKNKGSALIVVLCVLAVLMALSAALMVSTHSVVNNNARYVDTIQCKVLNNSFTEVVKSKIMDRNDILAKRINEMINDNNAKWEANAVKSIDLKDEEDIIHTVSLRYTGTNNYELFVNIKTSYKDEVYSQELHFVSVSDAGGDLWHLAGNYIGGNPS